MSRYRLIWSGTLPPAVGGFMCFWAVNSRMVITMLKKLAHPFLALALAFAIAASMAQPADAGRGGRAAAFVGGTLLGLGIAGAIAHAHGPTVYYEEPGGCYKGRLRCKWVEGPCYYNKYGDYICRRGHERCWRPTYCD